MAKTTYQLYKMELPDGKKYYGITKMSLTERSGGKKYARYHDNKRLYQLIGDYGFENIKYEAIRTFDDKETAHLWEGHYILRDKTYLPENGFNTHKNLSTYRRHYELRYVKQDKPWVSAMYIADIQKHEQCSRYKANKMIDEGLWCLQICNCEHAPIKDEEEKLLVAPYFDYLTK